MPSESGVKIADAIERLELRVRPMLKDGISISEIWNILLVLIKEAEAVYGAGKGKEKHALVKAVWETLDDRYYFVQKLCSVIPFPWWLRPFGDRLLRILIDMLISLIVTILNQTIWKK